MFFFKQDSQGGWNILDTNHNGLWCCYLLNGAIYVKNKPLMYTHNVIPFISSIYTEDSYYHQALDPFWLIPFASVLCLD